MPARSAKHGRSSKTSRTQPESTPFPQPDLLVDLDPYGDDTAVRGEDDVFGEPSSDTRRRSELDTPSRLPVFEHEEPGEIAFFHQHAAQVDLLDIDAHEEEAEAAPPIPIPVPRSQTPQLAAQPAAQPHSPSPPSPRSPAPPITSVQRDANRFSYGYGHSPTSPKSLESPRTSVSGLARTIRASVSPGAGTSPGPSKRFTAPLPLTRLEEGGARAAAPAVVDLGTASRGFGTRTKGHEEVKWARWDMFEAREPSRARRLLFVAYASVLQIWDTTDLEGVSEVLRLKLGSVWAEGDDAAATLVHAAVLPRRGARSGKKEGKKEERDDRALIGLGFDGAFIVYSLKTHQVVTRFDIPSDPARQAGGKPLQNGARIESFQANEDYIIISTTSPPTLYILSAVTFVTLDVIPDAKLTSYAPPPASASPASANAASVVSSASAMLSSAFAGAVASLGNGTSSSTSTNGPSPRRAPHSPRHSGYDANYNYNYNYNHNYSDTTSADADTMYHNHNHNHNHNAHTPAHPDSKLHNNINQLNVSPPPPPTLTPTPGYPDIPTPAPVYTLSHRLLAYASRTPQGGASPTSAAGVGEAGESAVAAAQRVGGSVWGGMRTLGGLAVSAARSRIGGSGGGGGAGGGGGGDGGVGRFFSRSAPEQGERERRERRYSGVGAGNGDGGEPGRDGHGHGHVGAEGYRVTVVDLASGSGSGSGALETVVEFMVGKERPVVQLEFVGDGCALAVVPRDGQVVQVFQIRPAARLGVSPSSASSSSSSSSHGGEEGGGGAAWHLYNLRRGRTSAVVEGVRWAGDGRWAAVGTRRGTVHVFGVNPYGGKIDVRSHLEGRVRNVDAPQQMPTDVTPVVRLRAAPTEQPRVPLAFTFITSDESTLPAHLLPPRTTTPPPVPGSSDPGTSPPASSPTHMHHGRRRATNFQDLLLFDPADASLSLRRVMLEMHHSGGGGVVGAGISAALGGTSISLPGMGGAGRLSVSASPGGRGSAFGVQRSGSRSRAGAAGVGAGQGEALMELGAKESTVMTWNLRRREGGEVRKIMGGREGDEGEGKVVRGRADWLAEAELSTCSKSVKILPRPIYLSHQFSFHTLGEDYHALIRRYHFDIGGLKIDVRREVQVSAYSAGSGESFVEGFASPRDIRHHRTLSSSFDEPLASALTHEFDHHHSHIAGVLPMLPNGTPGSFRSAIVPIRIGDGVSEGLERLRREIGKVRSPQLRPRLDGEGGMGVSVPLEFDEEDEDFLERGGGDGTGTGTGSVSRETSRGDSSGPTVSTPATSTHALDEEQGSVGMEKAEDAWGGWSVEDKLAVEEVERFDNIDVLGLLDEEQAVVRPVVERKRKGRARRRV